MVVVWLISVDSGEPVSVIVCCGGTFDIVEVADCSPAQQPADFVPVVESDDVGIASGQVPDPVTGEKRACAV